MWRPIQYFSDIISNEQDELDQFKFVGYTENNTPFDIRVYLGHPPETVTLYLPSDINRDDAIQEQIDTAIRTLDVPESALAWRRGWDVAYGQLSRPAKDRLREREARTLVLKILSTLPNWEADTSRIKGLVPQFYDLSAGDLVRSKTRKHEAMWRQIVGNVKVHHEGKSSIFSLGLAKIVKGGMRLTEDGAAYLKSIGFLS